MSKLLPYETIVKAHEGDPDAIDTILSHYAGYIRYCSKVHGKVNAEVEEHIKQQLIAALFKFRFDRWSLSAHTVHGAIRRQRQLRAPARRPDQGNSRLCGGMYAADKQPLYDQTL